MRLTVDRPVEIEAHSIRVVVPVCYGTEDIPADTPFRRTPTGGADGYMAEYGYDVWDVTVGLDTGRIAGWPAGVAAAVRMKVCDGGSYFLNAADGSPLGTIAGGYVPGCIPGAYGDYIEFEVGPDGQVNGWAEYCTEAAVRAAFFGGD